MPSQAKKGNYWKYKTKQWFEEQGYYVVYLEKNQRIVANGKVIFIKRDLLGCDGLSMNKQHIIFWQSKLSKTHISDALKEFSKYPWPKSKQIDVWVIVWTPRQRVPTIVEYEVPDTLL